ncbi:hypothetical protein BWR15_30540 [Pseudomonas sp. T]|nr:hypothetical protein BWR15_30540 [Pseudomonas sp. T]
MFEFPPIITRELMRLEFTCLDEAWVNRSTNYRFQCAKGHVMAYRIGALAKLQGCRFCQGVERIAALQEIAQQDGALCMDVDKLWNGDVSLYHFRCQREPSHEWSRRYSDAVFDSSCPHCIRDGIAPGVAPGDGLQRLQQLAQRLGGECLSTPYRGANQSYRFRCAVGHSWMMSARVLLAKRDWCPTCHESESGQQGLDTARQLALSRGGRFLSSSYRAAHHPYTWCCSEGHTWQAPLAAVRGGAWCRQCHEVEQGR